MKIQFWHIFVKNMLSKRFSASFKKIIYKEMWKMDWIS